MGDLGPSEVDVLIIGAGPSGLMLATWMARLGIHTRIIDKRPNRINSGQADGLQSRTFEILDSLGIGQAIWQEATHMLEIHFWSPDQQGGLFRSDTIVDTKPGLSRFQQATLHQAGIENHLFRYVRQYSNIEVEYSTMPDDLKIDDEETEDDQAHPVSVTIRHLPNHTIPPDSSNGIKARSNIPNGLYRSNLTASDTDQLLQTASLDETTVSEKIRAKYVVGCDGAHSWTRRQIGCVMEGESTDYIWGVFDIIPITDFPDIRHRCAIHSTSGSMMIIPRENKYVRLYIQVAQTEDGATINRSKITPETLMQAASKILRPYKLEYKHCQWWTAYGIGQRLGSRFSASNRVFLAGDAVHTHSPKAGQGMNVSMHDTYNLGWKLAHVIKGRAHRSLLDTYVTERRQIAQELITFDHKLSRLYSDGPSPHTSNKTENDLETFKDVVEKGTLFASGVTVKYGSNITISEIGEQPAPEATNGRFLTGHILGKQWLAPKVPIGMRMPSYKVLNQADARPWHLQERLPSNGTWRILVFAGDLRDASQLARYEALGQALSSSDSSLDRYTSKEENSDSVFEIITIHSAPRMSIELLSLPEVFHPFLGDYGWDYWKVFVDDESHHEGHGHAYENYGIDSRTGCMMVLRPDQHVSWIGDLEDVGVMEQFFAAFMRPRNP